MSDHKHETIALLTRTQEGDAAAGEQLFELVYGDLKALARSLFKAERASHTLQPTALVHEAYVRLLESDGVDWKDRAHFFATAARAMRRVLIDHARARATDKRGAAFNRVSLHESLHGGPDRELDLLALDQALDRLAELDERQARVVELRYLAGLTAEEVAYVLDVSKGTVEGDWRYARAWLSRALSAEDPR